VCGRAATHAKDAGSIWNLERPFIDRSAARRRDRLWRNRTDAKDLSVEHKRKM
jgi:hypothetical protein